MICAVGFIIRSESALQSYYLKHIVWRLQIIITWSIAYFKNTDSAAKSSHTHTDSPCKYLNHIELFVLSPQKNLRTRIAQSYRSFFAIVSCCCDILSSPSVEASPASPCEGSVTTMSSTPPTPSALQNVRILEICTDDGHGHWCFLYKDSIFHNAFAIAIIQLETHLFPERRFK